MATRKDYLDVTQPCAALRLSTLDLSGIKLLDGGVANVANALKLSSTVHFGGLRVDLSGEGPRARAPTPATICEFRAL